MIAVCVYDEAYYVKRIQTYFPNSLILVIGIYLIMDDRIWSQASLPIRFCGLGIRKVSNVSLLAFLYSGYSVQNIFGKSLAHLWVPLIWHT